MTSRSGQAVRSRGTSVRVGHSGVYLPPYPALGWSISGTL